jgi:hypothetical protein
MLHAVMFVVNVAIIEAIYTFIGTHKLILTKEKSVVLEIQWHVVKFVAWRPINQ